MTSLHSVVRDTDIAADDASDRRPRAQRQPTAVARNRTAWSHISKLGTVAFLIALVAAGPLVSPHFLDTGNLRNILSQNAPIGLIAIGMTFVMIGGGFDLSVGSIVALSSVTFAKIAVTHGTSVALAAALVVGFGLGVVNGLLVTRLRLNPFVATLATASIYSGIAYVVSDSRPIVVTAAGFQTIGQERVWGIPISVLITFAAFVVAGMVLSRTVFGHLLFATGGNVEAARLAGIRIDRVRVLSYASVGTMSALAGVVLSSRLGVGQANIGSNMTLDAITIVVIGGTSLFGGEGAIWRTAVGLLLLGVIVNIAGSRGWSGNVEDIVKGAVLLLAVGIDVLARRVRGHRT